MKLDCPHLRIGKIGDGMIAMYLDKYYGSINEQLRFKEKLSWQLFLEGTSLCSQGPIFPRPYVPKSYVPKALCSQGPMFPRSYVPNLRVDMGT